MRRLLLLVSALVLVDTMLYAALTPLLPHFAREFHLAKSAAGLLVAAYAAGALAAALPAGIAASRLGARRTVLLGLAGMAGASLAFAFAGSFDALWIARFVQGASSGLTWAGSLAWLLAAAPRERRGELLGTALGAAIFGALFGPVIGAAAALLGRAPVFAAIAVSTAGLAAWALREQDAPPEGVSLRALGHAFRNARFAAGVTLMLLPSLLFGVTSVLGPLRLSAAGWGAAAIGGGWLAGAALESAQAPLVGRLSDRRGRLLPVRISLAVSAVLSAALAFGGRPLVYVPLLLASTLAFGAMFAPAFALIADGAEDAGLAYGLAFGMMNAGWAIGAAVGPSAGGAIAGAAGDRVPFLLCAGICAAGFVALQRRTDVARAVTGAAES